MVNTKHPLTIRLAQPHEGPVIQALCEANHEGIATWMDWTRPLALNWLIAEQTHPIGCLMLHYGTPIGRMEFMVIPPGITLALRRRVVRALVYTGMNLLQRHGSQAVASIIAESDPHWQAIATNRGGVNICSGNLYLKRL
jgi:hypothetical protein